MKMKKAISWILSLMLVFTMIPALGAVAYAEDGGAPAIALGAGNIEKGNKVYMGIRYVDSNAAPISWLVLGDANSSYLKNSANAAVSPDNARLLITEKTLGGVQFDPEGQSNTWQGSNIQRWCTESFLNDSDWDGSRYQDHFTEAEKNTMLSTSKTDAEYNEWGASSLDSEKLFLLSAEEASDESGYFNGDESRIAYQHDKDETRDWWLRSPSSINSDYAARVTPDGNVGERSVYDGDIGARPAFNFDLTSVLFTSAAVGGKSSGACGADALSAISTNSTNEWELTLKDTSRSGFTAKAATGATRQVDEGYSGWSIPVAYSGANTGDNEYVSVILCNSKGTAKYYGNIAQNSAASSDAGQTVNIPDGLTAGSYTMYVFNEQINGDKLTDYSSAFSTINLTVGAPPEPKPVAQVITASDVTKTYGNAAFSLDAKTNGDGTLTYKSSNTKVVTVDSAGKATIKGAGTAKITISASATVNYKAASKTITVTVNKAANPLKMKPKTATVKYSKLKKKTQTLAVTKVIKFTKKLNDKKTYTLVSAKKGSKSFKKYFKINKTTGKVTIKKNKKMKKGTYKVKVKVRALGNTNYKASAVKTVTFKVKVN